MTEKLKLSTTSLKKKAKAYAKEKNISLNTALNKIANQHGFNHWSRLSKNLSSVVKKISMLSTRYVNLES